MDYCFGDNGAVMLKQRRGLPKLLTQIWRLGIAQNVMAYEVLRLADSLQAGGLAWFCKYTLKCRVARQ